MKRFLKSVVLVVVALMTFHGSANAGHRGDCATEEIIPLMEGQPASGSSTLCVSPRGLTAHMNVGNLVPGDAYTVWWTYIDDPGSCVVPDNCGDVDFGGDNPLVVFGRMDSGVVRENGRFHFSGRIRGMEPSPGSQIWLLVLGHGAVDDSDKRHMARQLLTPEDPLAGAPHLGITADGQLFFGAAINVFVIE